MATRDHHLGLKECPHGDISSRLSENHLKAGCFSRKMEDGETLWMDGDNGVRLYQQGLIMSNPLVGQRMFRD